MTGKQKQPPNLHYLPTGPTVRNELWPRSLERWWKVTKWCKKWNPLDPVGTSQFEDENSISFGSKNCWGMSGMFEGLLNLMKSSNFECEGKVLWCFGGCLGSRFLETWDLITKTFENNQVSACLFSFRHFLIVRSWNYTASKLLKQKQLFDILKGNPPGLFFGEWHIIPPQNGKKHPKRFGPFFGRPWTPIDSFVASIRKPMWITGWFTMTRGSGSTSKKALGSEGGFSFSSSVGPNIGGFPKNIKELNVEGGKITSLQMI